MATNAYIVSVAPRSGKSVIALGVMEMLSRRTRKVGFFRPIVPEGPQDNNIQLIRTRYNLDIPPEDMFAYTHNQARELASQGDFDELVKGILLKYKALEQRCNFVLIEGTDYTGVSTAFEFDINAAIANNLGAPVMIVINGRDKTPSDVNDEIQITEEAFENQGCTLLATLVNRLEKKHMAAVHEGLTNNRKDRAPVYVLPNDELLGKPTVGEMVQALTGSCIQCDPAGLSREVRHIVVAAMQLRNFLERIQEGSLIISPGDRADIILGTLATTFSDTYPKIAGIVLTGGLDPEPPVQRLIDGMRATRNTRIPVPVFRVDTDTYPTVMQAQTVRSALTPDNTRKMASALGLFEAHVDVPGLEARIAASQSRRETPFMFEYKLIERAWSQERHIVLPEGSEDRILMAADILARRDVARLTLLGDPAKIKQKATFLGLALEEIDIIDPLTSDHREAFAQTYFELRRHKNINLEMARDALSDNSYFGTMMVHQGLADGMVSGAINTTAHTIRPAFEFIRTRPGVSIVSSVFFMCLEDRVLVYGDCAINPDPNAQQLADIAVSSADTAAMFGVAPRVAMLSYSTGQSGKGADVDKVREATRLARECRPDLKIEGPIQYDAAIDASVARTKMPESEVAGKATVFIFPDLNTGNNTYKAVQRSAKAVAVGPVLQGLNKPVNDLSRGCLVADIVNTVAITAIQAQTQE
ncbi:MAG: phosphate acetyltransferase [Desulfobacterales bacterium]|nr:phosphate acetyltransferase [Desulfobacterales bacterium]